MEEGLLVKKEEEEQGLKWTEIREEMKRICKIAGPMIAVMMSQYMIQVVTLMMVGHLGNLYLASTALAVSLAAVTGFSFMVGMSGGLETISGQAYGAKQYMKVGTQTYTAIFTLTIMVIPLSIIWINMGKLLIILGQDPLVAHEAGKFMTYLVPTLFAYAVFQPLVRYFQSQSLVVPMFLSSCATLCLHIPLCWALVYKSGLQNLGGAIAMGLSNWLNAIFLALYMKFSPSCVATRSPFSMDIFHGIGEFLRFAIPSSAMVCFEWWSYELVILLSGLLPNAELETSVLSVCLTTTSTLFAIPYGISSAASTRVANELGAENPQAARTAAHGAVLLGVANGILVSAMLYATRNVFGYCFSSEKDVIKYISSLAYLVCANALLDSIQAVISGVARGCGWQHIGSFVNLVAFYVVGIPVAAGLAFWMRLNGTGLRVGILCGAITQTVCLAIISSRTNWEAEVGMSGGLETISGQAYGAKQYMKVGTQTYTAIFTLTIMVIPLSIIWINMGKLLIILGQDPLVAHEAGKFMTYLVPTLFAYAVFQPLVRYFQSQSLVVPMFLSSCATLCLHIPLCWALVYKSGLQNLGGAIAMGLSNWLNAIFLALYMKFSPSCVATRSPFSMDIFHGIGEFLRFAIPSSAMVCFEWWSYELVILLSGLLPNAELETSVLSVCLTTTSTLFAIPYGISSAASTRVANELGAENPQAARTAAHGAVVLGVANGILVSAMLYATRNVFGYCFSSEKDVIKYISSLAYLVCANALLDSIQAVISGVARGCGWQHIGSFVNLVAFYVLGIPVAAGLAFWMRLNGTGLRVGILCGAITQTVCLAIISSRTNWEAESRKARRRKLES